ncbi:DegV family protein [uncultured Tyzzerella sp.]|uniref:DegV family protein n=1 Tax=uncultured Tyzzerella sp. TaxID=2321398 RepID=UPI0029426C6D|nr:DegV family protein [uncultured Tyzzerella sp.]
MQNFIILSDSSCDLPENLKNEYNIDIVPFYVSFDKENYLRENIDININDFYEKITKEKIIPKTSLPSMEDYCNHFRKHLDNGLDILCFTLTSDFSGSYQSAVNAANIMLEDYPDRKILVIDSRKATVAQGLLVVEAAKMQRAGFSLEETYEKMEILKNEGIIIFTIDTLEYLQKGGRIGKASALAGNLLNIKPILLLDEGVLQPHSKVRGRKKSLSEILKIFNEYIKEDINNYQIAIAHAYCEDEAIELEKLLKEKYDISLSYPIFDIGITIGAHTGATAIGIGFIKKFDV